jgi:hypothetical protein
VVAGESKYFEIETELSVLCNRGPSSKEITAVTTNFSFAEA